MKEQSLQVGKTRYTHYSIASHLVGIPKYQRRILTGEGQKETKRLIAECCERQGLTLLALETDEDHMYVFVSAPPRFSPALIANLLKGSSSRYLREQFPHLKKVVERIICGPLPTTLGRQGQSQQKPSNGTSKSARGSDTRLIGPTRPQPA